MFSEIYRVQDEQYLHIDGVYIIPPNTQEQNAIGLSVEYNRKFEYVDYVYYIPDGTCDRLMLTKEQALDAAKKIVEFFEQEENKK